MRAKGGGLSRDDEILAVDERAVDIEHDELHGPRNNGRRSAGKP
jgi:hypothetical protein